MSFFAKPLAGLLTQYTAEPGRIKDRYWRRDKVGGSAAPIPEPITLFSAEDRD